MGKPEQLSEKHVERLEAASRLKVEKQPVQYADGSILLKMNLPAHGVASITIDFEHGSRG
jgi:hypothetical protein